jgi:hypothetical protein
MFYYHCAITIQSRYLPYLLPNHELRVLNIEKSHDFMKCRIFITIGQVEKLHIGFPKSLILIRKTKIYSQIRNKAFET